jgi:solute:Na+ symporter, SSS family
VTTADFINGRYQSPGLALAIAFTGLLATMPYIALQLVGLQVVLEAMGIPGEIPLVAAFVILAAYTYTSGLRAPALIAGVKDTLIYITVIVAVIYIPYRLGGFGPIFESAGEALPKKTTSSGAPAALIPAEGAYFAYSSLVLGSALALFLYPHAITGVLASGSQDVVRRNTAILPAYTLLLGLLALFGYMAIAANFFPSWFVGFAFAAIGIGALVPAAVMSIAAANLFTRNIYKQYLRPQTTDREETKVAQIVSLVVKGGALVFVLLVPVDYAIDFQLLGGVWILQTGPALVIGLFTRWFHKTALLIGWAIGMAVGTAMSAAVSFAPTYPLAIFGGPIAGYIAVYALIANLVVAVGLTFAFNAAGRTDDGDDTAAGDYDEWQPELDERPAPAAS